MFIPPEFLDILRDRIRPSEVLGRKLALKHKGGGEYTALCPFHNEKTPSFTVSDNKGFYHCFGCGVHGDIISFLVDYERHSFVDAIKILAEQAGLPMPEQTKEQQEHYVRIQSVQDVLEKACQYYENCLSKPEAIRAKAYLAERSISEKTIQTFRIGFAPDDTDACTKHLLASGIALHLIEQAGLCIIPEGRDAYDRFRGRIIYPIMDSKGRVIAFGGRVLPGAGEPKYLNSPETELFKKGEVLYAWHLARPRAVDKSAIVLVEGYMDVIALHQAGITNAVAPLGTALTAKQLELLWHVAPEPVLCMDSDNAGSRAMARAAELALPLLKPGSSLKFAFLPTGKDPDDVIKHFGTDALRKMLISAIPLSEAVWNMEAPTGNNTTPEHYAAFETRLMAQAERIGNATVRAYYRDYFQARLKEFRYALKKPKFSTDKKNISQNQHNPSLLGLTSKRALIPTEQCENVLVSLLYHYPELVTNSSIEEEFLSISFKREILNSFRSTLLDFAANNPSLDYKIFRQHLETTSYFSYIESLSNDPFVEALVKKHADILIAKQAWRYHFSRLQFMVLEEEYAETTLRLAESEPEKVWELKKQKDQLKMLVEQQKMSYETALEE